MIELETLIRQLEESGKDIFWQGKTSQKSVDELEALLGSRLPNSFRYFLCAYGGGGLIGEEISGIEDDNPKLRHRGTVLGDTLLCRLTYGLPDDLVAVYLGADDDVVWCLDVARFSGDECPVVSFDVVAKTVRPLTCSFDEFLREYLGLRIAR